MIARLCGYLRLFAFNTQLVKLAEMSIGCKWVSEKGENHGRYERICGI